MSTLTHEEEIEIQKQFIDLLDNCVRCDKPDDKEIIKRAFLIAYDAHKEARRRSGEPYIIHPLSVAKIVNQEIGLGVNSIVCALLHDVVEDADYTLEQIERNFGPKVASIIDGLTKIGEVFDRNSSLQAENFRKMLLTLSDDLRVIIIKLADRLHNMRTLGSLSIEKQKKISSETLYLYAPLAHRMGLYTIKTEMEDLSFKHMYPEDYKKLITKINADEKNRLHFINKFSLPIIVKLNSQSISYEINGRPKSIFSIWNKMQTKDIPFEEVYDLFAIRIVFEPVADTHEKTQCWNIYSLITDIYPPRPDRIRDWVSTPKANGYEALHVTVMGPEGKWVEVQIRSKRMDEIAERGFAAHWKYKNINSQENELDKWLKRIREVLEDPSSDALEFLDDFKLNLFSSEIVIFTPKGEMKTLPKDSTVLDFAYEIHSQIGNKAIGGKVNHKLVPLNYKLSSGDQVEIITSDKQKLRIEWLDFVITAKAKSNLKNAFKAETKNRIEKGKVMLEEKLKEYNLRPSSRIFHKILPEYDVTSKEELYSKIGTGIINLNDMKRILKKNTKSKWIRYWELTFGITSDSNEEETTELNDYNSKSPYLLREGTGENTTYVISKCCNPIPGDEVVAYRSEDDTIIIHKSRCSNAIKISSSEIERIIPTRWTTHKILSFLVRIGIEGMDNFGIFNNITTVITKEFKVNIRNIDFSSHDGIFEGLIDLYVHNTNDLNNLLDNLSKIKGVEKVSRIESVEE